MAELHILTGGGEEQNVVLDQTPLTFGRGEECDFVLEEQRASRRHCTFHPCGEGWRVEDEQSSNGTWLGGRPVLSSRLQSGDEIEIGETVISYFGRSAARDVTRPRRVRAKKTPWGLLAIPLALGVGFAALTGLLRDQGADEARDAWKRYARATIQSVALQGDRAGQRAALKRLDAELAQEEFGVEARRIVKADLAALSGNAGTGLKVEDGASPTEDWQSELAGIDAGGTHIPIGERRHRLIRLLDRHMDDPAAAQAVGERLSATVDEMRGSAAADRGRTAAEADAALEAGELGKVLDAWTAWRLRAPQVSHEDEKRVAKIMANVRVRAKAAADQAVAEFHGHLAEGRSAEAAAGLDLALKRLQGTGYATWLRIRGGRESAGDQVALQPSAGTGGGSTSARELTRVLRVLAKADEMARLRQYPGSLTRLKAALESTTDGSLRDELTERIDGVSGRIAFLASVLERVAANPRGSSPLKLSDGVYQVTGSSVAGITLVHPRKSSAESRMLESLSGEELNGLLAKCGVAPEHYVAAALTLHDGGSAEGYTAWMRLALAMADAGSPEENARRLLASRAHARATGKPLPDEGFVPHPSDDAAIITYDEFVAIQNAKQIALFRKELTKLVEKLEATKQAQSIGRVAAAYKDLEDTRNHALELIFDTVKYFYPYKDRPEEYAPVSKEVDNRVNKVFAAWSSKFATSPRKDTTIEKIMDRADDLVVELDYLQGESTDLTERMDAITRYLGHDLTVRTFFVTTDDLAMLRYNDKVMSENATKETMATDDEREQVRLTNEYRIIFGHRRAVAIHDQLVDAARGHSDDMNRLSFFAHFSPVPGKRSPGDRVKLAGYPLQGASENIHMGSSSPKGAHDGWRHSSGHHRNLLAKTWVEMGTGRSGRYWTQNFGLRSGDFGDFK